MSNLEHHLWIERYRPQVIEDCILPRRLKDFFIAQVSRGDLQNMLLIGGPGVGKTTCAKAMCKEMGIDVLFLNASEQGGIEILRSQIRSFASTVSFLEGKHRCVILDEADYLNPNSTQPALRGFLEEFAQSCRFILTANFGNRILDPIKSRCAVVDFSLKKEEKMECIMLFNDRVKWILDQEHITYDKVLVADVIKKYFPDYRKVLNELQRSCHSGSLETVQLSNISDTAVKEVIQFVKLGKFDEIRKWAIANADIDFHQLVRMIFEKIPEMGVAPDSLSDLVLILAEYDYKRAFVMNSEIHTVAMLCEIMTQVNFK